MTAELDALIARGGIIIAQSFDLLHGGYQYHATGKEAPKEARFKFFKTREETIAFLRALRATGGGE